MCNAVLCRSIFEAKSDSRFFKWPGRDQVPRGGRGGGKGGGEGEEGILQILITRQSRRQI
jgi:hypothetical protein